MNDQELVTKMKDYVRDIRQTISRISEERIEVDSTDRARLKGLDEQLAAV